MCVLLVLYPLSAQHVDDLVKQWGSEDVPVDEQGFHGITCSWVVTLGVSDWKRKITLSYKPKHKPQLSKKV